jgi:nucleotide-binding universal stress UspA family protein
MKLLETILLPTDFGKGFRPALDTAVALAKAFQSKLVLLHVIPESMIPFLSDDGEVADIETRLIELGKQIAEQGVEVAEIFVDKGVPAEVICREANSREVNLIVLGCRTRESGAEGRPGVTAERVLRRAVTPVWIARPGTAPTPNRILCPTDMSRSSRRALKNALILCRKLEASLVVLNVQEPIASMYKPLPDGSDEKDRARLEGQQSDFERFLGEFDFHGVEWSQKVRRGSPSKEIVAEAVEQKADLVAIGTVGKTGVERILIGSVTHRILEHLPCSILTTKEEDVIRLRMQSAFASIEEQLKRGHQLLDEGMSAEAIQAFDQCLLTNPTNAVAWDGKALAYERLGKDEEAEFARTTAKRIRDTLWQRRVEAEIRGQHGLLGKKGKSF